MNKYSLENYSRPILQMPHGRKKLLLHSCCAPCAGEIMAAVAASDIDTSIFFYNPNICLLYTSPSPRDGLLSRMPSSA